MNQKEMVEHIAEKGGCKKAAIADTLKEYGDLVLQELCSQGEANLVGLGKLVLVETKERKGRNPATGEEIIIPPRKRVKFKPAKALKDAVLCHSAMHAD
jgi:DNA-binding protein HU-beta